MDDPIKKSIIDFVEYYQVIPERSLYLYLSSLFPTEKESQLTRSISESVQANEIRRYEYVLSGESTRRAFYMPINSRLML